MFDESSYHFPSHLYSAAFCCRHFSLRGQDISNPNQQIRDYIKMMETSTDSIDLNLYLMIKELYNLGFNSFRFRIRPLMMDGGGGSYSNYVIHSDLKKFLTGDYSITRYI